MGRLIDIDVLFDYFGNDAIDEITRSNIEYFVSEKGTVKAIPKADYKNRLKADMVAMLTDIQLEIEELRLDKPLMSRYGHECYGHEEKTSTEIQQECSEIIQQKIDELEGEL